MWCQILCSGVSRGLSSAPRDFTGTVRTFPTVLQKGDWQCALRTSSMSVSGEINNKGLCSRFVTGNVAINLNAQQLGHVHAQDGGHGNHVRKGWFSARCS